MGGFYKGLILQQLLLCHISCYNRVLRCILKSAPSPLNGAKCCCKSDSTHYTLHTGSSLLECTPNSNSTLSNRNGLGFALSSIINPAPFVSHNSHTTHSTVPIVQHTAQNGVTPLLTNHPHDNSTWECFKYSVTRGYFY